MEENSRNREVPKNQHDPALVQETLKPVQLPRALGVEDMEIFDITCIGCKKRTIMIDGEYHCKLCGVMCENCSADHQKMPKAHGHWAQKIKLIINNVKQRTPSFKLTTKCEFHPSRNIKGYCIDCAELYCKECRRAQHQNCAREKIEDMCINVSRESDMIEARHEITDLKARCNKAGHSSRNEMVQMARQSEKFTRYVHQIRNRINVLFDDMVSAILRDRDEFCKDESKIIESNVSKCSEVAQVLDEAQHNLNEGYRSGKDVDMWIALKKLERVITHYDEVVRSIENDRNEVKFEFVPNTHLASILEAPENVGKIKVISSRMHGENTSLNTGKINGEHIIRRRKFQSPFQSKDKETFKQPTEWVKSTRLESVITPLPAAVQTRSPGWQNSTAAPKTPNNSTSATMKSLTLARLSSKARTVTSKYKFVNDPKEKVSADALGQTRDIKLTYIGKKEIMIAEDSELCCITGSTYLPNGRLVLVDNHNKTLKLFSSDFELLSSLQLKERPWNVASCYQTVISISYPYDNLIELINTGIKMKIETSLKTDRMCYGMAFHKVEKWLYVACGHGLDACVIAYSLDGHVRKVIIPKAGVLHEPCYMVMTGDSSTVYISDLDNGIVGFNTKSGDMVCQYKNPKVKRYWGLVVNPDGRLFVITTNPDCIYVLEGNHNGQMVMEFKSGNKPCSMSYSAVEKKLVLTRWKAEDVEVFKICVNT